MVWTARILGLAVFCGISAAYAHPGGSPYETSVSYDKGSETSTPSKPAYTGGMKSVKTPQKCDGGKGKKYGVKKEQKVYDGGEKKDYDGGDKKNYNGGDKKKYDVKKASDGYGSGYSDWNQEYNDCVQQCKSKYGPIPSATNKPSAKEGNPGGRTHTIIVAPTQGVLRYLPFAVNPSPGDTVKFMWGANNHTVTKSSALLPCNKTLDTPFASGTQNKDFVYDLVINDTQPIYLFCGTPSHCQKGMFAMINPPSNVNGSTSMGNMLPSIAANNSKVAAYSEYVSSQTNGSTFAAKWGEGIDLAALPEWSYQYVAENVLYTRSFLGNNVKTIKDDGSIDLSGSNTTPLAIPKNVGEVSVSVSSSTTTTSSTETPSPETYQTTSDIAVRSMPSSQSSLSTSGGYAGSASKALILGHVAFVVSLFVV